MDQSNSLDALLRRAVDATREGMVITDPRQDDNPIIFVNRAFGTITGYDKGEVIGRNCRFLQGPDSDQRELQAIREAFAEERPVAARLKNYKKEGTPFWNDLSIAPIRDSTGRLTHYVGLLADVSDQHEQQERQQLQNQQTYHRQRLQALGTFASGIAHDVNNTLVPIAALGQLLRQAFEPGSHLWEAAEQVCRAGERSRELVSQIVAFARQRSAEPRPLALRQELLQAIRLIRPIVPENCALQTRLEVDPIVLGNPHELHQVIFNLVTNAIQATSAVQRPTICVSLSLVHRPDGDPFLVDGTFARLSVEDNGIGMEAETQRRAFEPFFTTKDPDQGSGMGLAIVHGIVTATGGSAGIEGLPGGGTRVVIHWPVVGTRSVEQTEQRRLVSSPDS